MKDVIVQVLDLVYEIHESVLMKEPAFEIINGVILNYGMPLCDLKYSKKYCRKWCDEVRDYVHRLKGALDDDNTVLDQFEVLTCVPQLNVVLDAMWSVVLTVRYNSDKDVTKKRIGMAIDELETLLEYSRKVWSQETVSKIEKLRELLTKLHNSL